MRSYFVQINTANKRTGLVTGILILDFIDMGKAEFYVNN